MRKTFLVKRSKLYSAINYSEVLASNKYLGFELLRKDLEPISVHSGTVCLFDPYATIAYKPLLQQFPVGECSPFSLSIKSSRGEKIALAGMKFSSATATEWKLALFEERDVLKLINTNEVVGTMISSGLIAFGDYLVAREYAKLVKSSVLDTHPIDNIASKTENVASRFIMDNGMTFAVCSSGFGEGKYRAYIGLDENGNVTNLIVDFEMVEPTKTRDDASLVPFEFNMSVEESYQNDAKLSESENNVAKWSYVLAHESEVSSLTIFNAYSKRGNAYENLGREQLALDDYLKAIDFGHTLETQSTFKFYSWSLYDKAGAIYLRQGKVLEAKKLFEQAKKFSDTFYGGAYVNLIDIYLSQNDYSQALAVANEMVADRPQDIMAYSRRSEILIAQEEYEKALPDLDTLIDTFRSQDAILKKTECLTKLNRASEALPLLDAYAADNKLDELYYFNRAQLYYKIKNIGEAYTNLTKSYECNNDYLPTLKMLIEIDKLTFNNINLVKLTTKYIELRPREDFGYIVRAEAYAKLKNYLYAGEDITFIIDNISNDSKYYNYLLKSLLLDNNYSRAKKCVKTLKKRGLAYYSDALGYMYLYKRKYARAGYFFSVACKQEFSELFLMDQIDCLIASGQTEKAQSSMLKLLEINPDSKMYYIFKAKILNIVGTLIEDYYSIAKAYLEKFLGGTSDTVIVNKVETFFKNILS